MFRSFRWLMLGAVLTAAVPQVAFADDEEGGGGGGNTWSMRAGGVQPGSIFEGQLGFSNLPQLAYHYILFDGFSLGGQLVFDYMGYYLGPGAGFTPTLALQMPLRISVYNKNRISAGIRVDPGIGFTFFAGGAAVGIGILLHTSVDVGYWVVENKFMVGGGINMPVSILIIPAAAANNVQLLFPLLFGPILEFHAIPQLAITGDLKFGPFITSAGVVSFGARMLVGMAYKF